MDKLVCEFCNKTFSSKYTLNKHKTTTKKCVEKQKELNEKIPDELVETEVKPSEVKPSELKPSELKPSEVKPSEDVQALKIEIQNLKEQMTDDEIDYLNNINLMSKKNKELQDKLNSRNDSNISESQFDQFLQAVIDKFQKMINEKNEIIKELLTSVSIFEMHARGKEELANYKLQLRDVNELEKVKAAILTKLFDEHILSFSQYKVCSGIRFIDNPEEASSKSRT